MGHISPCVLLLLISFLSYGHSQGARVFTVTTTNANVRAKEGEGAVLTCSYSADFGSDARIEWKFVDKKGSTTYVYYSGQITAQYRDKVTVFGSNLRFNKVTRKDNGEYDCAVSGNAKFGEVKVKLTVLVPPSPPLVRIPQTVTTGKTALLTCHDSDGSPPPIYKWYKDGTLLPVNPSHFSAFKNLTYKMNPAKGNLEFPTVSKADTGSYSCEAVNGAGPPQRSKAQKMEILSGPAEQSSPHVVGLIVRLLVVILLAILLLLLSRYKTFNESCWDRFVKCQGTNQDSDQMTNQRGSADDGHSPQHGGNNIYETIKDSQATETDKPTAGSSNATCSKDELMAKKSKDELAAESSDVTYSQIELKHMGKKKKDSRRVGQPNTTCG